MVTIEKAGIDAGGTLCKVAMQTEKGWVYQSFPTKQMKECIRWLNTHCVHRHLCITGGKASIIRAKLKRQDLTLIPEFSASCAGARELLNNEGHTSLGDFILTNVGTGTSLNHVKGMKQEWMGGTGVGGGTLIGLSGLLTGVYDYSKLIQCAEHGKRDSIDLTVARIYEGETPPIPGDLTASNFGAASAESISPSPADQVASVIGLVAETVTSLSVLAAQKAEVKTVVYIGSSFVDNSLLQGIVTRYSRQWGLTPIIPEHGSFCGAIGAALS
ncbi:type II pantothenate kinase [Sporolactobacillus shoreicorticis]|uniref:Type II pantothenate kinase n=1 Tax=Sporolactobacillus shoreicorticis TaxID=1923877 RepID=A0ABW5S8X7_9BACL|nr:type II pantothenate kinase [Sporolactobacillus shoreicorticis]MCO7127274.1 type II pantothenate kinase [Sporolactobacillus shoreicorticis]